MSPLSGSRDHFVWWITMGFSKIVVVRHKKIPKLVSRDHPSTEGNDFTDNETVVATKKFIMPT